MDTDASIEAQYDASSDGAGYAGPAKARDAHSEYDFGY